MKHPMKIKIPKTGYCAICGEPLTDWAHILGRGRKGEYANDVKLIIELCKKHHTGSLEGENHPETMRKIADYQINKYGTEWLYYCMEAAQNIGTKPKWVSLCLDLIAENFVDKIIQNIREMEKIREN